jgi:hypothetical protein
VLQRVLEQDLCPYPDQDDTPDHLEPIPGERSRRPAEVNAHDRQGEGRRFATVSSVQQDRAVMTKRPFSECDSIFGY